MPILFLATLLLLVPLLMIGSPAFNSITTVAGMEFLLQRVSLMFLAIRPFVGVFAGAVLTAVTFILADVPNAPSFFGIPTVVSA